MYPKKAILMRWHLNYIEQAFEGWVRIGQMKTEGQGAL